MSWLTDFLFGKTTPAPPPPDYATANKTAIETDAATLPFRNAINAASQMGTSYTDPSTGKVYDFTGLGQADINAADTKKQLELAPEITGMLLKLQQQYGPEFAAQARKELEATDPTGFALRESLGKKLAAGDGSLESLFAGQTAPTYEGVKGSGPDLGSVGKGPEFQQLGGGPSLDTVDLNSAPKLDRVGQAPTMAGLDSGLIPTAQKVDTSAYSNLQRLSGTPQFQSVDAGKTLGTTQTLGAGPSYGQLDPASLPAFANVNAASLGDRGATASGRSELERQIMEELGRAGNGQLDPALAAAAQQASRARGAASGNILGDSSALQESLAVQLAQQQRNDQIRQNALGLLSSGQSTSDKANTLSLDQQQADTSAAGFNNSNAQQGLQNRASALNLNNDALSRGFQDQATTAGFNNDAATSRLGAEIGAGTFNNAGAQQTYLNQANNAGFNNAATAQEQQAQLAGKGFNNAADQQAYQNQVANQTFNNAAGQQNFQNQVTGTTLNNQAAQQGFDDTVTGKAFNNTAAQQQYTNQANATQTNNAAAQQGFQNQVTGQALNNDAASTAFANTMAAINQRNQASQNTFGSQQGLLSQQANARQQDSANTQSFLGLQPIVSQGAQLSGLQNQAAPFMQGGNYSATGVNPAAGNQGTAFAGNIFGTQAGIFGTNAAQNGNRGFLNAFSQIAGGTAKMAGAGLM